MSKYLALLRGVNVGGKGLIPMADLCVALSDAGLADVQTYIQSGNVIFSSDVNDTDKLAALIAATITKHFKLDIGVAVFSQAQWAHVISVAPAWWGKDVEWKHNLLILLKPYDMDDVVAAVGQLKPDIEAMEPGEGVLYQSMSLKLFGRTTTGKINSSPIYKKMTVRNYNTANKLVSLLS
jgi:uncharacterized protein (DUF1697 family)